MDDIQSKIKQRLLLISVVVAIVFGYAGYFLWSEIVSARDLYTETYRGLLSIEKKQEQASQLQKELASTEKNREEILSSLLAQDETLNFIVSIEDIAQKAGLSYEVRIIREVTEESIEQEKLALKRSRRKAKEAEEALERKLPGIVFEISLEGSYLGIIRFLEGVASLPYYTHIESFNISAGEKSPPAGGESKVVKAIIQMVVFTKK